MKLKKLTATNVHGYMEFNSIFNEDINFIIGGNGSGKTTAIKIVAALLGPSIEELAQIHFDHARIEFEQDGEILTISCQKIDDVGKLSFSKCENADFVFSISSIKSRMFDSDDNDVQTDGNSTIDCIRKLPSPIFINLDRHSDSFSWNEYMRGRHSKNLFFETKKVLDDSRRYATDKGLLEAQLLVVDTFRKMRAQEASIATRMKKSIVKSLFTYTEMSEDFLESQGDTYDELSQMLDRRGEIEVALTEADLLDTNSKKQMEIFFKSLNGILLANRTGPQKGMPSLSMFNLLLNKAQLERIREILKILDDHKNKIDDIFQPVTMFVNIVNKFFVDSGKRLFVDKKGDLKVHVSGVGFRSVDELSSGERQVLILFSNLIFKSRGSFPVLIIDEPELSLHLRWQRQFVDAVIEASPDLQTIMATHSPEIIGRMKNKCINVN